MTESKTSNDKYSIIIPYRNREDHIRVLLPRLQEFFSGKDFEIIVSEQTDKNPFNISCVQNVAYKYCSGNVIVLNQVDYYPLDDVSYEIHDQPILPANKGIFINKDLETRREIKDIPAGYRNWENGIDPNFYGGVIVMRREHWENINGLNPMYEGWGNEDEDLRERFKWAGYKPIRNKVGTFLCLYHEDNGNIGVLNKSLQKSFIDGRKLLGEAEKYKHIGYKNLSADVKVFDCGIENVKWIKSTNYKIDF